MNRQFLKLFSLIFFSLFIIALLIELVGSPTDKNKLLVDVHAIKSSLTLTKDQTLVLSNANVIELNSLAWPEDLLNQLVNGEIVSLTNTEQKIFHYWLLDNDKSLVIQLEQQQNSDASPSYLVMTIIFYSCFAVALSAWLLPMFRDANSLIKTTREFSSNRHKIKTNIHPKSIMYPLAQSVENMSRQIVRFLALQRFLASSVSHDIRTPLSRIEFLLEVANEQDLDTYKKKINLELDEINTLTDNFIELARIEECHHQLNIRAQDIKVWLVPLIERVKLGSNINITSEFVGSSFVEHDKNFLLRATQNLIINAIKYADSEVKVSVLSLDNKFEIRVEDDGTGINPEEQEKLMGLYQRGKSSKNIGSGYGIGLAFVNVIAEWHGGNVSMEKSDIFKGASVSIYLPTKS